MGVIPPFLYEGLTMIVMGIDHSLTSTGVTVMDGDIILCSVAIATKKQTGTCLDTIRRIREIAFRIKAIAEHYKVTHFCIEELAYNSKGNATRDVAMLFGAIAACVPINTTVPPSQLKKFATGYGAADKKQMVAAIAKTNPAMYTILTNTLVSHGRYDMADSFWLCQFEKEKNMQIRTALTVNMTEEDLKTAVIEYIQRNSSYPNLVVDDIVFQSKRNPTRVEVDVTAHNDDGTMPVAAKAEPAVAADLVDSVMDTDPEAVENKEPAPEQGTDLLDELLGDTDAEKTETTEPETAAVAGDDLASLLTL